MIDHYGTVKIALISELEKWDNVLGAMFRNLMKKEIAKKIKE